MVDVASSVQLRIQRHESWQSAGHTRGGIDEELQVVKQGCFNVANTHQVITDHIDLVSQDSIYSRVVVSNPEALSKIAGNRHDDEIFERFRETAQILTNPNWQSFVNTEQFCALREAHAKQLSIHSILMPRLLSGFASVTMTSANFLDSLIYKLWGKMGVEFIEDVKLSEALRFQEHTNGSLSHHRRRSPKPTSSSSIGRRVAQLRGHRPPRPPELHRCPEPEITK
jgi:hypothetical protein